MVEVRTPAGDALQLFAGRTVPVQVVVELALVVHMTVVLRVAPLLGKIEAGDVALGDVVVHGGSFNE